MAKIYVVRVSQVDYSDPYGPNEEEITRKAFANKTKASAFLQEQWEETAKDMDVELDNYTHNISVEDVRYMNGVEFSIKGDDILVYGILQDVDFVE